jgi:glycosyltransferase involved in cell wall biosynthesis
MPVKRFDALIDAVAEARRTVPGVELVIVGDGAEREHLEDLIQERDAAEWVRLAGRVTDDALVDLYQRAWVLASASVAEGWGMTITEAAACGTPAVVTDIGGHRDAVVDGVTGLLVAPEQLGQALARVLSEPDLRRRLAEGALERTSTLTWEATAAGTLAVLAQEALRKRG